MEFINNAENTDIESDGNKLNNVMICVYSESWW